MPFRTALSGLNAASANLRVLGNNIANASTTGFKESRAEFADVYASSGLGGSSNAIGSGVRISNVSQQFSQGNIGFTDNGLDLAVNGQGFFIVDDGGVNAYTRAGAFSVDRDGYIVNNSLQRLQVFQADINGNITGALADLQLDTSDIAPNATGESTPGVPGDGVNAILNLDSNSTQLPAYALVATAGSYTTVAIPGAIDYATQGQVGFDVDGNTVVLDQDYASNAALAADVDAQLPAAYNATVGGGGQLVITNVATGIASTAPVLNNFDLDPDANGNSTIITNYTVAGTSVNGVDVGSNFDRNDPTSYSNSTSLTIYDSLGNPILQSMYFRKTDNVNEWEIHSWLSYTDSAGNRTEMEIIPTGGAAGVPARATFNSLGQIQTVTPVVAGSTTAIDYDTANLLDSTGAAITLSSVTGGADLDYAVDLLGTTQYGSAFSVNSLTQDGYASGRLRGLDVGDTGIIQAQYSNGQSRILGQVALANFSNSQGLRQVGDTSWSESFDSGAALVGSPGTSSLGVIQSGALEGSNVELTEQLVNMITAQRNFQANAQVITTADTITQTIINIR